MSNLYDSLFDKIIILDQEIWHLKLTRANIDLWLDKLESDSESENSERIHFLYLLSQFSYFGYREIREILKTLFNDKVKYPIIRDIRTKNKDTLDHEFIEREFKEKISKIRILGLGNPSESGAHLLYLFRQENGLDKNLFIHFHEIFDWKDTSNIQIKDQNIERYIFIDDLCGSGSQLLSQCRSVLSFFKKAPKGCKLEYYPLFATSEGLSKIYNSTENVFDIISPIFKLDNSFKCFSDDSRYFSNVNTDEIDKDFAKGICEKYGNQLYSQSLGFANGQLLIGFQHNIPNNTLPIFWSEGRNGNSWMPIFTRNKKYLKDL
ncbi:hypothetical protein AB3N59_19735 [Leptospira sp. WS92.C1]